LANATNIAAPNLDVGLAGIKMAAALFIILALIFIGFYLLRRFGSKAGLPFGRGKLNMVASLGLGPKKNVVVVRFLNKYLVLGVTETQINKLMEMDADHETEQDFSSILAQEKNSHSRKP
jgi:flagellar protein FliO/FliZ